MFFKSETRENPYIFAFCFRRRTPKDPAAATDFQETESAENRNRTDYFPAERFFCSGNEFRSQKTPSAYPWMEGSDSAFSRRACPQQQ